MKIKVLFKSAWIRLLLLRAVQWILTRCSKHWTCISCRPLLNDRHIYVARIAYIESYYIGNKIKKDLCHLYLSYCIAIHILRIISQLHVRITTQKCPLESHNFLIYIKFLQKRQPRFTGAVLYSSVMQLTSRPYAFCRQSISHCSRAAPTLEQPALHTLSWPSTFWRQPYWMSKSLHTALTATKTAAATRNHRNWNMNKVLL